MSLDSGATYTKFASAILPTTYITAKPNIVTDLAAATGANPTAA